MNVDSITVMPQAGLAPSGSAAERASVKPSGSSDKAVDAAEFGGAELAMVLAVANIVIERLRGKVEDTKRASGLKSETERANFQKMCEQMEAAAKAAKSGLFAKIFGWIGKILALAVSVVAVAATGGAASPFLAAAVVLAAYDIAASAAMEANPNLHIGLADGLGKFVGLLARACGASAEEVKQAEQWGGLALSLVLQIGVCFAALGPNAASTALKKAGELLSSLGSFFVQLGTRAGRAVGESFEALAKSPMLAQVLGRMGSEAAEAAPLLGNSLRSASTASASGTQSGAAAARSGAESASAGAATADGAAEVEEMWSTFGKWQTVAMKLQPFAVATQGANSIASGVTGIIAGVDQHRADLVEAESVEAMALVGYLQAFFDKEKDEMEVASRDLGAVLKKAGELIESRAELDWTISSNFAPQSMV